MYELDKEKFGAFVAQLRKEKGYTQKELAERLYISNKAVSKWETGASIPDTALLVPLAEQLGVTVTELLLCQRQPAAQPMDAGTVEEVVKAAIHYAEEKPVRRAWQQKSRWKWLYFGALLAGAGGLYLNHWLGAGGWRMDPLNTLDTLVLLAAIFGGYFCFLVRQNLPAFYDENRIHFVSDGPFRMMVMGLAFNNHNWPHIVQMGRAWSCGVMALLPLLNLGMSWFLPALWAEIGFYTLMFLGLAGLFLPLYWVGKRYENGGPFPGK